jgi:hypothetical protein
MIRRLVIRRLLAGRSYRAYLAWTVGRSGPDPGLSLIIAQKRIKGKRLSARPSRRSITQGSLSGERRQTGSTSESP